MKKINFFLSGFCLLGFCTIPIISLSSCASMSIASLPLILTPSFSGSTNLPTDQWNTKNASIESILPTEYKFWPNAPQNEQMQCYMTSDGNGEWFNSTEISYRALDSNGDEYVYSLPNDSNSKKYIMDYEKYIQSIAGQIYPTIGYGCSTSIGQILTHAGSYRDINATPLINNSEWLPNNGVLNQNELDDLNEFMFAMANVLTQGTSEVFFQISSISFDCDTNIFTGPGVDTSSYEELQNANSQSSKLLPLFVNNNEDQNEVIHSQDNFFNWQYQPYPVVLHNVEITYSYYNPTIFNESNPETMIYSGQEDFKKISEIIESSGAWDSLNKKGNDQEKLTTLNWELALHNDSETISSSDERLESSTITLHPGDIVLMCQYIDAPNDDFESTNSDGTINLYETPEGQTADEYGTTLHENGSKKQIISDVNGWFFAEFANYWTASDIEQNHNSDQNDLNLLNNQVGQINYNRSIENQRKFIEATEDLFNELSTDQKVILNKIIPNLPKKLPIK